MNEKMIAPPAAVQNLITKLSGTDLDARQAAYQSAGPLGAAAVLPLGDLLASPNKGVARAAKFALENIAHHAARPVNGHEAREVSFKLLQIAESADRPQPVRAEALYLLGFTGERHAVGGIARLLNDTDVQDEARMALERIPGKESLDSLKRARRNATPLFQTALDQSIYNRSLTPQVAGKGMAR